MDTLRKMTVGVRTWMQMDSSGQSEVVKEVTKQVIMKRTGLTGLDLRMLDPSLSYPSTLLGRESAIIVNVEHIKAVIMAHEILLLNFKDPSVVPLVEELRQRIGQHNQATKSLEEQLGQSMHVENSQGPKLLPFEFVALEACLFAACNSLDVEFSPFPNDSDRTLSGDEICCPKNKTATAMEEEAYPALDEVTSRINALNLERVHKIKSRLLELTKRVQKVRDELDHLLNDDDHMAKMYLTNKLAQKQHVNSSLSSINDEILRRVLGESDPAVSSTVENRDSAHHNDKSNPASNSVTLEMSSLSRRTQITHASKQCLDKISKHLYVKELEIILEAYFVQIDAALNGLSALREYVEDTEDYLNIMLDDKRNILMQNALKLMIASLLLMIFTTVTGTFSMNIRDFYLFQRPANGTFIAFCAGGTASCIVVYAILIWWLKFKGLL